MTAAPSNIIPFAFEDHLVRVVKPNGEPWFVGKDVCEVLHIRDHHQALERLDEDERGGYSVPTPLGEQIAICVSEPGVYRLIFTSRKPEAERFKRWLAHEVLPALRKQGSYTIPGREPAGEANPLVEFPAADGPLAEHMAKLATLRECRMIHGPRAAARLWRRLGMPQVTESAVEEMDEGRRCLAHLLGVVAMDGEDGAADVPLRDLIGLALDEDLRAARALKQDFGLLAIPGENEGLFVPNSGPDLRRLFGNTPWDKGQHVAALRRLPGALPMKKTVVRQVRGTFVPMAVIETMPLPLETGGNVVPLRT